VNTELLVVALGAVASLAMLAMAGRMSARDTTLTKRMAAITSRNPAPSAPAEPEPHTLRWLEIMLLCAGEDREEVNRVLRAADILHPHAVVIFAALRLGGTVLVGLAAALALAEMDWLDGFARVYPAAAAAAAFIGAKMALRSRIAARVRRIGKELPFALDVMLLMLESGVSLDQCLRHLAQWDAQAVPTIQRVMGILVDDLHKGMAYEAALERWADRMNVNGARELASLFRQTILHGTELAPALKAFVVEFSEKRIAKARDVVGKKTTQMTVVMIFFLMPALMIVIAGPAVVAVLGVLNTMAP
jgi:tight adherence protein C